MTQQQDAKLAQKRRLAEALRRNLGERKMQRGLRNNQGNKAENLAKADKAKTGVAAGEP